ncbi:MAG: thioredoxin domain-containing protein [Thermomicrobiales bacterium]|nr:thioredoxin domain-containing protein [Thermomicrobiales bacterium]
MANRLANETSPYLLQHAGNPVDWYPWGPEALEKARAEDKPMLVSIGYSACHWCHVMEHESFENPEIAAKMNDLFVNIKVDREERPDLDSLYMTAVQAMTGHGGWPLNVFLTPDGVPFYGGTYFPPEDRMGMPGFPKILDAVADAYRERRDEVDENAEQIRDLLRKVSSELPQESELGPGIMAAAVEQLESTFDPRNGGFGSAPKFPQPAIIEFLIRYAIRDDDERARTMARKTLDQMANGGIYDHIGGGFHRYAVDAVWLVPHFEKMLYDNAQLASAYLAGYQAFGDERYRAVAEETLDFVAQEMTDPRGGFYATLDADTEGEEGVFYTWTPGELEDALGASDAEIARVWFNVTPAGNFEGRSILSTPRTLLDVADRLSLNPDDLAQAIARIRKTLREVRSERVRPGRDEKVITAWNGMMLRAFADGSRILDRDDFRELGRKNAAFILEYVQRDGHLLRSWKDGDARIGGFLEDYALFVDGLLALYRATLESRWLVEGLRLTDIMVAEFADSNGAGFFDTASGHEALVARPRDLQDGATPSGNSAAAGDLLRLGAMTGNGDFSGRAVDLLRVMARTMREHPLAAGGYLNDLDFYLGPVKEIALAGDREDSALWALLDAVYDRYEPNSIVGYVDPGAPELLARLPFLQDRPAREGRATAYLCEHFACLPPVHDPEALLRQLTEGTGIAWRDV